MTIRKFLYKLKPGLLGQKIIDAIDAELNSTFSSTLFGVNDVETAMRRIDGTGIGSRTVTLDDDFTAQSSNIQQWFGNRATINILFTDSGNPPGVSGAVLMLLPGSAALNTAFDILAGLGIEEKITWRIGYSGPSKDFVSIRPRNTDPGTPQIQSTSSITVRSGIEVIVSISRINGVIQSYIHDDIGTLTADSGGVFDSIKIQNPANAVWDASENGTLPTNAPKGFAYFVTGAPSDGSGRFNEPMRNGDLVVWTGESFTSWQAEPHQWIVIPAHEVRRITALQSQFLSFVLKTPFSHRNQIIRNVDYSTEGEIRLKFYPTRADYTPADLNTTGDQNVYNDSVSQTGFLGIRLPGTTTALQDDLSILFVFRERSGNYTYLASISTDFTNEGTHGVETDFLSNEALNYNAGDNIRVFTGTVIDRFNIPNLDIFRESLSDELQAAIDRTSPNHAQDNQQLASLQSKVDALFPLTPDVDILTDFANVFGPKRTVSAVRITPGYSLFADYRSSSDNYESAGVTRTAGTNVNRYSGLSNNLFRGFGFKVPNANNRTLLSLVDGSNTIPFLRVQDSNYEVNNYRNETGQGQPVTGQNHFITRTSGDAVLNSGGNVSTYTLTPFPTGATNTIRTMSANVDILLNGTDTLAGHFIDVAIPNDNTAQPRDTIQGTANLGPRYSNRRVSFEIGYEVRIVGDDALIDFYLNSAPSDITIQLTDVLVTLNYTPSASTSRVDVWEKLSSSSSAYSFTGQNEILMSFHPYQSEHTMNIVPVVRDSSGDVTQLNDDLVLIPAHGFDSVEVDDTVEFRTFSPEHYLNHSDLASMIDNFDVRWVFGKARLDSITEYTINQRIDFTSGIRLPDADGTLFAVSINSDGDVIATQ